MSETVALRRDTQQKDNLCGAFCAARILRALGAEELEGAPVDEDLIALRAGSTLPREPSPTDVPPGAEPYLEYRYELLRVPAEDVGTTADALAEVIDRTELRAVPLSGDWTAAGVERVLEAAQELDGRLLANLRTGALWSSRPPLDSLLAELRGDEVAGPGPEWDVGHWCELSLLLRGPAGALVLVHDTYPTLGWNGYHLQPPRAVAAALNRGDGREGGILAVAARENAERVEALAAELGLGPRIWDNLTRR